ncbi:MAG: hypothetical protein IPP65_01745 [Chlorobi bacterium]|nr:hypothetical protein [Chlorobiota bacterium]
MENYGNTQILNEFAFNANVGDIGKFRTPGNRITIIKLLAKRPSGIPQFETFPNYVAAQAKRAKQMTMLKPKMQELSKKITVDMLVGPMEEYAKIINVFLMKGQPINTMPDEEPTLLDSLVTYTKTNQHSGPVRGKNGYYFLRVSEKSGPNMDDWERDKEVFAEKYLSKYKNAMVTDLINKSRSFSKVKDLRPQTIKVLKEFIKIE